VIYPTVDRFGPWGGPILDVMVGSINCDTDSSPSSSIDLSYFSANAVPSVYVSKEHDIDCYQSYLASPQLQLSVKL
jgi:hypothetical protein